MTLDCGLDTRNVYPRVAVQCPSGMCCKPISPDEDERESGCVWWSVRRLRRLYATQIGSHYTKEGWASDDRPGRRACHGSRIQQDLERNTIRNEATAFGIRYQVTRYTSNHSGSRIKNNVEWPSTLMSRSPSRFWIKGRKWSPFQPIK